MEYVHIKNLEKYHPGYKDRKLQWAKLYFSIVTGDTEFEMIENEIDKWRFVAMLCLELNAQKPIPNDDRYWRKYFNIKKRPMSLTLKMLHNFIDIVTEVYIPSNKTCNVDKEEDKDKEKEEEIYKEEEKIPFTDFEKSVLQTWNSFCQKHPILASIKEISEKRRQKLKKRFERESFRDFGAILQAIEKQPFLMGENPRQWKVDFDWLIENDTNYLKVLEMRYAKKETRVIKPLEKIPSGEKVDPQQIHQDVEKLIKEIIQTKE